MWRGSNLAIPINLRRWIQIAPPLVTHTPSVMIFLQKRPHRSLYSTRGPIPVKRKYSRALIFIRETLDFHNFVTAVQESRENQD
jgi:hypothetical protein